MIQKAPWRLIHSGMKQGERHLSEGTQALDMLNQKNIPFILITNGGKRRFPSVSHWESDWLSSKSIRGCDRMWWGKQTYSCTVSQDTYQREPAYSRAQPVSTSCWKVCWSANSCCGRAKRQLPQSCRTVSFAMMMTSLSVKYHAHLGFCIVMASNMLTSH